MYFEMDSSKNTGLFKRIQSAWSETYEKHKKQNVLVESNEN